MKSTYNLSGNFLQELPEKSKPDATRILGANPNGADYEVLDELIDEYNTHIASLRTIPCSEECKSVFKDKEIYEEGKDYMVTNYPIPAILPADPKYIAVPLSQPVQEDELWEEVYSLASIHLKPNAIKAFKQKFTITKKK
jgi:hypothetical protein